MLPSSLGAARSVALVIPVLNEAAAIGWVVGRVPRDVVQEVIVVDGGSRDGTADRAAAAGARVIAERRHGYGRACATGAAQTQADIVAFADGDGSDDPAALPDLLAPIVAGSADLVLGARTFMEAGALPAHAVLANRMAAWLIRSRWHQPVTDLASFKVLRRQTLLELRMSEATYGWTLEMIVKTARRHLRIEELPLAYHRRQGGVSKVSGNLGTSVKAASAMLGTFRRHAFGPLRAGTLLPEPARQAST